MKSIYKNINIKKIIIFCSILVLTFFPFTFSLAQNCTLAGDANCDGQVNATDLNTWTSEFTSQTGVNSDFNADGKVDMADFEIWRNSFYNPTPTSTPVAATTIPTTTDEWSQFGHDAQHTSWTPQTVSTPWKFNWEWNGAGNDGKQQAGHLNVPDLVQPITGGGRIYYVASNTLFAFDPNNGNILWQKNTFGTLNSTPIYDSGTIYLASMSGILYKISATDGSTSANYNTGSAISTAPNLSGSKIFVTTDGGKLIAINKSTMAKIWEYDAANPIATTPSYSASKDIVVIVSQDLNVHAVNAATGALKWKTRPTVRTYQAGTVEALAGWPVIADSTGTVFVRYRLDWNTLWDLSNPYPTTNAAIRSALQAKPNQQALFALNMNDGTQAFVPAVGNGGAGDGGFLPMGPQPVVATVAGKQVVYTIWRNGLTCAASYCDAREDATMGEMVLDNSTVAGYNSGDVRFVKFIDIQTDEMKYLTASGSTIFHNHWLASEGETVTDRSAGKGATFTNPIATTSAPYIIWRQVYCPSTNSQCNPQNFPGGSGTSYGPANCPFNAATRYCAAGLYSYGDQRGYPPGFYEYHNDSPQGGQSGTEPFTIVSGGKVIVKTLDGGLMILGNGNPQTALNPDSANTSSVLGASTKAVIAPEEASQYVNTNVTVEGKIASAVSHLPKAVYLGFKNPHDGDLLIRIFQKDLSKFSYDPMTLNGKKVRVKGFVTLYWPEGKDPEIIVTDPSQITILP